jgi:hypothetical protein
MKPRGNFARLDVAASELAAEMQGLCMDYLQETFLAEEDVTLQGLTWQKFFKLYEAAKADPAKKAELDRMLGQAIGPAVQMALQPPQQGQ